METTQRIIICADLFDVTPKEYAIEMGMTHRGAQKFFRRQVRIDTINFRWIGVRVRASRTWFNAVRSTSGTLHIHN